MCFRLILFLLLFCKALLGTENLYFKCSFDKKIYEKFHEPIKALILQIRTQKPKNFNAAFLLKNLKEKNPIIKRVQILKRSKLPYIKLIAEEPFFVVDKKWVISCDKIAVPIEEYNSDVLTEKFEVTTESNLSEDQETALFNFIEALPKNFRKNFSCIWQNKTSILFIDKAYPNISIIANLDTKFDTKLIKALNDVMQRAKSAKNKKWTIDIRYGDRVILAPVKNINKKVEE